MKIENFCDEKRTAGRMQRDARASTTLDPARRDDLSGGGSWVGSQCWVVVVVLFLLLFCVDAGSVSGMPQAEKRELREKKTKEEKKKG